MGARNRKLIGAWSINFNGYVSRKEWRGDTRITVLQHRKVVEDSLGYSLDSGFDVHHINGVKTDNRLENLMVVKHGEHTRITNSQRTYTRGKKIKITDDDRIRRRERIGAVGKSLRGSVKSEATKARMREAQKIRRRKEKESLNA